MNDRKGPNTEGEKLHAAHSKNYSELLSAEMGNAQHIKLIHQRLTEQAQSIKQINADLNLPMSREDLATAVRPITEEISTLPSLQS